MNTLSLHSSINLPNYRFLLYLGGLELTLFPTQIAMDFLKNIASGGGDSDKSKAEGSDPGLLADAKLVAEAAKFTYNKENDKVDKAKTAGAAADLLDAAEKYGKFGDQGVGKYVNQAEEYLHNYEKSNSSAAAAPAPAVEGDKPAPPPADTPEAAPPAKKEEESGGGYGDALKMAGSFFK